MAICATANPAIVNWLKLKTPMPNCEMVITPYANWPMAMKPLAGTGRRFAVYLNEICRKGRPRIVASDLYSNPNPSHFSRAGYGAPQPGQKAACSEILRVHSRHGFIRASMNIQLRRRSLRTNSYPGYSTDSICKHANFRLRSAGVQMSRRVFAMWLCCMTHRFRHQGLAWFGTTYRNNPALPVTAITDKLVKCA